MYLMNTISLKIIDWYNHHSRSLPWREINDPYKIWLSEIILQQTRVDQGLPYYLKFVDIFPTVIDLANAEEDAILKLWQGLGYYLRARNLHTTAKIIRDEYNGIFPTKYDDILALKGVGEYTAAAITSFAYNLPYSVVDGNVYRVLSRIYDIDTPIDSTEGKKLFKELAQELLVKDQPGLFNQAIMEFGSQQCCPTSPNCDICPVRLECLSYQNETIKERPVKYKKTKVQNRYLYYFVYHTDEYLIVKKRNNKDIWQGLYDFPLIEKGKEANEVSITKEFKIANNNILKITKFKHILSHQRIHATFILVNFIPEKDQWESDWELISYDNLKTFPLSRLIDKYLKKERLFLN